jgi:hypothetical protein
MTDGRVYTMEDEIDVLHEDLGRARRHVDDMLRAESDGRVADQEIHAASLRQGMERVRMLERQLAEACAEQIAAAEGFGL